MTNFLNHICLLCLILTILSCQEDSPVPSLSIQQFRHLYLVDSSFAYRGQPVMLNDTVYFLYNKTDTIIMHVSTTISDQKNPVTDKIELEGVSNLVFESEVLNYGQVSSNYEIIINGINGELFQANTRDQSNIDTTKVLGKTYLETFKYPDNSLSLLSKGFKRVYFALDYGLVLVEMENGALFELLPSN